MNSENPRIDGVQTNELQFMGTPEDLIPILNIAKEIEPKMRFSLLATALNEDSFRKFLDKLCKSVDKSSFSNNP